METVAASILSSLGLDLVPYSGEDLPCKSPIDGQDLACLRVDTQHQVHEKIALAQQSFKQWRLVPAPGVASWYVCLAKSCV